MKVYRWAEIAKWCLALSLIPADTSRGAMFKLHKRFKEAMKLGIVTHVGRGRYTLDDAKLGEWIRTR